MKEEKIKLTLILGDCLKVLPTIPSESVDLVLTDPPQKIARKDKISRLEMKTEMHRHKEINYDFGDWDFFDSDESYLDFMKKWIDECIRILKPNANFVIFISRKFLSDIGRYIESKGFKWKQTLHWIKTNPVPHLRKVTFANGVEQAIWCSRGKNVFNYQLGHSPNYFISSIVMPSERHSHPTEKKRDLIEWILNYLSNEGQTVLDCFLGSGTTMDACLRLKRNCVGIEINPEYIEITKKRLNWGSSLSDKIEFEFKDMSDLK